MLLFLDSGAYSAKNKGETINIDDYMAYVSEHHDLITVYANLDVIGDAKQTWENQKIMESCGFTPLPVFHMEDDMKYLDRCLDYPRFCLGGMAGETPQRRHHFFDECWEKICNTENRNPCSLVHGFGMTSPRFMYRYPWYSVDSTSWVSFSKYGAVIVPKFENGKPIYDRNPSVIFLSIRSPSKDDPNGRHFERLTEMEQAFCLRYFHKMGFELGKSEMVEEGDKLVEKVIEPGLCNDLYQRDQLNLLYYADASKNGPGFPWALEMRLISMFDMGKAESVTYRESAKVVDKTSVIVYFAGNFPQMSKLERERAMRDKVEGMGYKYGRLISFYYGDGNKNVLKLKEEEK